MKFQIKAEDVAAFKRNGFTITKTVVYCAQRINGRKPAKTHRGGSRSHGLGVLLTSKHAKFQVPDSLTARVYVAAKRAIEQHAANKNKKGNISRTALVEEIMKRTGYTKEQVGPAISTMVLRSKYMRYTEVS
ncbi:MAG: hypothetical protein FVQ79_00155 [Planctomycetes bacterium]|nr:hypothetical protein [Planctomycetota bacterium]